ncbi:MAG: nucleoside hydrolase [Chloroflexi bacterium]|nr:nucleoside hydrolase [Chloroflexota bacterium]
MATKILIDTDPGVDDTMAILLALRSPELEVVGLTSIFGNTSVEVTAQNALRLVELEGHDSLPVAKGASRPLARPLRQPGTHVHGEDGMGGTHPPPPHGKLLPMPAAQFIVEMVRFHPGEITLVPLGPLTNIALAVLLEPGIVSLVKEVVLMGGSAYARGNATPAAEANICNDPHAASIVFRAGWPLTMVGLDVTTQTVMTPEYLDDLGKAGNPATELIHKITPHYQAYFDQFYGMKGSIHTHDPSAVACVIDPSIFGTESMPVYVETEGRCAGETVPDRRRQWLDEPPVKVCLGVDSTRLLALIKERLTS